MIVVYTTDMERLKMIGAVRFRTDEHNNLEILTGKNGEDLAGLLNESHWSRVAIEDDDDDEDQVEPVGSEGNPIWGR